MVGTNTMVAIQGVRAGSAGMLCKQAELGSIPRYSTNSFSQSHLGEGGRLLTGEGTFESCCESQCAAIV